MKEKTSEPIPPELEQYIALCKRIFHRMEADGSLTELVSGKNKNDKIDE